LDRAARLTIIQAAEVFRKDQATIKRVFWFGAMDSTRIGRVDHWGVAWAPRRELEWWFNRVEQVRRATQTHSQQRSFSRLAQLHEFMDAKRKR
jgi:hypothetical protein